MKIGLKFRLLIAAAGLIPLLVVSFGCDKDKESYSLYFSHNNHVKNYEVACTDCHGESKDGSFAKPGHTACIDCHDDWMDKDNVSEKTCGECHKARDLGELSKLEAPESTNPVARIFVHTAALSNRCTECHGNLFGEKLTKVPEITRSDRIRIRTEAHKWQMDCNACHVGMDQQTAPPSHDQNWMRRHGDAGRQADNSCSVCHSEQSCRECHSEMMPASHNNLWRTKTHGIEAAWDRARCETCHEEDSCTACHSEVKPQSHTAAWRQTHCQQCHPSEATGTGCTFCHEGGLDAHPNPHPADWVTSHCRSCHDGTPASEQCNVCHGGTGLDTHPNPHPANWEKQHCTQCHDGRLNGVSCSACHGGNLLDDHPNPHPGGWLNTHCVKCHDGEINGVSCKSCHGSDIIDDHPNPHKAGFRDSHCFSCHPGSQAAEQCEICHEGGSSVLVHEDFWPPVHDRFGDQANCYDCHHP